MELGAQAEKEAVAMFNAKMKQNSTMEQEEPPPANEHPQPPAPGGCGKADVFIKNR